MQMISSTPALQETTPIGFRAGGRHGRPTNTSHPFMPPGFRATVIAAGAHATYLRTDGGEIYWLCALDAPLHRRAIPTAAPLLQFQRGMRVHVQSGRLFVGDRIVLCRSGAFTWAAQQVGPGDCPDPLRLRQRVIATAQLFADLAPETPFAPLLLAVCRGADTALLTVPVDPFARRAWPHLTAAWTGCARRDPSSIPNAARALVGMGPGLTPSGDDLLGGMLFALALLAQADAGIGGWETASGAELVAAVGGGTNEISRTILGDLASGEGPEPLHRLALVLLRGTRGESVRQAMQSVLCIGHHSGTDLLAGFLAGLTAGFAPAPTAPRR